MKKNEIIFDFVKLMRDLRQKISNEISGLSNEEIICHFKKEGNKYETGNRKPLYQKK
jgi:hypothetical protein